MKPAGQAADLASDAIESRLGRVVKSRRIHFERDASASGPAVYLSRLLIRVSTVEIRVFAAATP